MEHSQTPPLLPIDFQTVMQQLYLVYYGRPADPGGLEYWTARMASGLETQASIIAAFGTSAEFQEQFGSDDNETLVDNLYQQIFGRPADSEGLDFYVDWLTTGEATLVDISWRIIQGVQEGNTDALIVENRTAVAQAVTEKFIEREEEGDYDREVMKEFISGITDDIATRDSHLTDESLDQLLDALDLDVVDQNHAPVFANAALSVTFAENNSGTVFVPQATDEDGDTVVYSLGGADAGSFNLNTATNAVTFIRPPDYEAKPSYDLIVTASDGSLDTSQAVTVQITDVLEFIPLPVDASPPVFISGKTAQFQENDDKSLVVYDANATDNDGKQDQGVTYGLGGIDAPFFTIEPASGAVNFFASPNFEEQQHYTISVVATDASGNSATQDITITLVDVDEAPIFNSSNAAITFDENQPITTTVHTLEATDPEGSLVTYSLVGENRDFAIDANSGVVTFVVSPDFEAKDSYIISVVASDGLLSTLQNLTVNISNINEQPRFTGGIGDQNFEENKIGTVLTIPEATDVDGDQIRYTLGGDDADKFQVDPDTRAVTFINPPNFEKQLSYTLTMIASDGFLEDTQDVTINIVDTNDAPVFANQQRDVTFAENAIGTVFTLETATDEDDDVLTYSLGGTDAALFNLDGEGKVTFITPPDSEDEIDYDLTVIASDGILTGSQKIDITIVDVNEPPIFTSSNTFSFDENQENTVPVFTPLAVDPERAALIYTLGGTDAALFDIDAITYAVTFKNSPNFENDPQNYSITITADDGVLQTVQTVTINIGDVNDAPVFANAVRDVLFPENSTNIVFTPAATDEDGDALSYSLSGANATLFDIDINNNVTFKVSPDFEGKQGYLVFVTPSDGTLSGSPQKVNINITDVDEITPTLLSSAPVDNAPAFEVGDNIVLTFDENIDFGVGFITLYKSADDSVIEAIDVANIDPNILNKTGSVITIDLPNDLAQNTDYYILIDNDAITDLAGNSYSGISDKTTLNFTSANVNDAPVFDNILAGPVSFVENATGTVFTIPNASDVDGDVLTYTLTGNGSDKLTVDPITRAVTFINPPDFEQQLTYTLTMIASDGFLEDSQTIILNINDVDEINPILLSSTPVDNAPAFEVGDNIVLTFDENIDFGVGSIEIYRTVDDNLFMAIDVANIDPNILNKTGSVITIDPPNDLEQNTDYYIVIAKDAITDLSGNPYSGISEETTLSFTTANVNDAPIISNTVLNTYNVDENIDASTTIFTAAASDVDGDGLTYTLEGDDKDDFSIDQLTKAITFNNSPDFEGQPQYDLVLRVTDDGDGALSVTKTITINIRDVDEAPEFTSSDDPIDVVENIANGAHFHVLAAIDPEGNDAVTYSLQGADKDSFSIGTHPTEKGFVWFKDSPDFETKNSYSLEVVATAGGKTTIQTIIINIKNVDEPPEFTSDNTAFTFDENQPVSATVFDADADDPELDTITYSLVDGEVDSNKFDIDTNTGIVTFKASPDFENPEDSDNNGSYSFTVTATAAGETTDQTIIVNIGDVNEAPVFKNILVGPLGFDENAIGTVFTIPEAEDEDGDTITYTLEGEGSDKFIVDAATRVVTFINPPDHETQETYTLKMVATDNGTGFLAVSQDIILNIRDVDEAPEFTSDNTPFTFNENQVITTTVYDADSDDPESNTITYSLVDNADADKFDIDTNTGIITFKASPNFENPDDSDNDGDYSLIVRATAGGLTKDQNIIFSIGDVDEAPEFTSDDSPFTFNENQATATTVFDADANDPENIKLVLYSLFGDDSDKFDINTNTGIVTFKVSPDFENPGDSDNDGDYSVSVRAVAGGKTTDQTVIVTIGNVDENPVFTSDNTVFTFDENQIIATAVFDADANDPESNTITYSLIDDTDADSFDIDTNTGVVTFKVSPDFENPDDNDGDGDYSITVRASDGVRNTVQVVTFSISNVDEAPEFTSSTDTITFSENQATAITVYDADADDPEGSTVTYSLVDTDVDSDKFDIDTNTGIVTFKASLDFETPGDNNGDGSYSLSVRATAGGKTTDETIIVNIGDVNEEPQLGNVTAAVNFAENQVIATAVYTASASDEDDGDTIVYSLTGGDDVGRFDIDQDTGVVTFNTTAPDFEAPDDNDNDGDYVFVVTASDGALSDTQTVTVTIDDVNEAPVFPNIPSAVNFSENNIADVLIIPAANDQDTTDVITYSLGGDDFDKFTIDPITRAVTFKTPPDFENPDDNDGDGDYELSVIATDDGVGTLTDIETVTVTVTNNTLELGADPYSWDPASRLFTVNFNGTIASATATDPDDVNNRVINPTLNGISVDFDFTGLQHQEDYLFSFTDGLAGVYEAILNINVSPTSFTVTSATDTVLLDVQNGTDNDDVIELSIAGAIYYGLGGDDTITGDDNDLTIDGGVGTDQFSFEKYGEIGTTNSVDVDLANIVDGFAELYYEDAAGNTLNTVKVKNIENIVGSEGSDRLVGDAKGNGLQGLGGDDTLSGGMGIDVLTGGSGADTFIFMAADIGRGLDEITDFAINEDIIDVSDYINTTIQAVTTPTGFALQSLGALTNGLTVINTTLGVADSLSKSDVAAHLDDPNSDGNNEDAITTENNTSVSYILITDGTDGAFFQVSNTDGNNAITASELKHIVTLTGISDTSTFGADNFEGFS